LSSHDEGGSNLEGGDNIIFRNLFIDKEYYLTEMRRKIDLKKLELFFGIFTIIVMMVGFALNNKFLNLFMILCGFFFILIMTVRGVKSGRMDGTLGIHFDKKRHPKVYKFVLVTNIIALILLFIGFVYYSIIIIVGYLLPP
jgi:hypothetical protein